MMFLGTKEYKGYTIGKLTKNDYIVYDKAGEWLTLPEDKVSFRLQKEAKEFIDSLVDYEDEIKEAEDDMESELFEILDQNDGIIEFKDGDAIGTRSGGFLVYYKDETAESGEDISVMDAMSMITLRKDGIIEK